MADATNENGDVTTSSPSPHADRAQREVQPGRAGRDRAGVARADARGERRLERRHARAERELARAQHLEHRLLLGLADHGLGERDRRRCVACVMTARARRPPRRACGARGPGSMPASSESTSASQLASITFSETPIAPHVSVPSEASSSTRVTAPVAFCSSRMRTL